MQREKIKSFVSGFIVCGVLSVFTMNIHATPVAKVLDVTYNNIKLVVDGFPVEFGKDGAGKAIEPFIHNGTTYLPVRAVGEALDKNVAWDGETQTIYIGKNDEGIISFENNSKDLSNQEAKNYAKEVIHEYSKTMWNQWDWTFKFSDDPQENMILLETTYKEQLATPWEEHPIYVGFTKAQEEMRNSDEVSEEELAHLSSYIEGFKMEHEDSMKLVFEFGEAPPQKIYIAPSNDGSAILYVKGYYQEDKTYVDDFIELEKWLEHKVMTVEEETEIADNAYKMLYEELDSFR